MSTADLARWLGARFVLSQRRLDESRHSTPLHRVPPPLQPQSVALCTPPRHRGGLVGARYRQGDGLAAPPPRQAKTKPLLDGRPLTCPVTQET